MKNRIVAFLFLSLALSCIFILRNTKADVVKSKYFNYVEKGAKVVKTSPSTQYRLMETYPQATVTVYEAGTLTLASLWIDKDGLVIKANPFTADTDSFYYFYVDCGKYDIKFSGTGITSPYSYGDIFICGAFSDNTLTFSIGTSGTDFNVSQVGSTVTYNLPDASLLNRGAVTIVDQSFNGNKTFDDSVIIDSGDLQFTGLTSGRITIQPANIAGAYTLTLPIDDGTSNQVLQTDGNGILSWVTISGGGGSGTVIDFSAGNLSPLFTTSVATSTTTPALTFNLANAGANTYFGNNTGSSAAPSFVTLSATSPIVISQGVGTTTLSCPTCGGGTLINPTDNIIPYRANATTFNDSPLYRATADTIDMYNIANTGELPTRFNLYALKNGLTIERLSIFYETGGNKFVIDSNTTGGSLREIQLSMGGTTYWTFRTDGKIFPFSNTTSILSVAAGTSAVPGLQFGTMGGGQGFSFSVDGGPFLNLITNAARRASVHDFGIVVGVGSRYGFSSNSLDVTQTDDVAISRDAAGRVLVEDANVFHNAADMRLKALQLTTGSKPTCSVSERGKIFYTAGGGGAADTLEKCVKSSSDVYAWIDIATIVP